ncbi:MAG: hypothetical protein ACO1O1_14085 [Adhaeribacter sp.]
MNVPFKHFFNACQPEFKSLHGVSWEVKPELYYQYLQTRYLALIAESLGQHQQVPGQQLAGSLNTGAMASSGQHPASQPGEDTRPAQKQEKEHIET